MVFLFGRNGLKTSIKPLVHGAGLCFPAWSAVLQPQRERCGPSLCPGFVPRVGSPRAGAVPAWEAASDGAAAAGGGQV